MESEVFELSMSLQHFISPIASHKSILNIPTWNVKMVVVWDEANGMVYPNWPMKFPSRTVQGRALITPVMTYFHQSPFFYAIACGTSMTLKTAHSDMISRGGKAEILIPFIGRNRFETSRQ
ncbi:hypothetical protein BZG36_05003, partial [Bifiguratus adelaidae]